MGRKDILQRIGMRHWAGHDVAMNGAFCESANRRKHTLSGLMRGHILHTKNTFRLQLEEGLVGNQANVVFALRSGASQTCSLTSAHENKANLILGNGIQRDREIPLLILLRQLICERNLHIIP